MKFNFNKKQRKLFGEILLQIKDDKEILGHSNSGNRAKVIEKAISEYRAYNMLDEVKEQYGKLPSEWKKDVWKECTPNDLTGNNFRRILSYQRRINEIDTYQFMLDSTNKVLNEKFNAA